MEGSLAVQPDLLVYSLLDKLDADLAVNEASHGSLKEVSCLLAEVLFGVSVVTVEGRS